MELIQSTCLWYDMLIHDTFGFDTKQYITNLMKNLQMAVKNELDRRFIYFLASRTKIRFCIEKKPKYSYISGYLILYIEIGGERKLRKISTPVFDYQTKKQIRPSVEISDRFITFQYSENRKESMSIHDFLSNSGVDLGINTEIHYVGYTKNPSTRPLNGSHRGLTDMFYKVSNQDNDFFIFYNLFKVTSVGIDRNMPFNFVTANSMINEIEIDEEGKLIEKAFIKYFGTEVQETNKNIEEGELENGLKKLSEKNNINSIVINYEMGEPSELYRFFSRTVEASDRHFFTCCIGENGVEISKGKNANFQF